VALLQMADDDVEDQDGDKEGEKQEFLAPGFEPVEVEGLPHDQEKNAGQGPGYGPVIFSESLLPVEAELPQGLP